MLKSDLCDFSDAYIVVKGNIVVTNPKNAKRNKSDAFKNSAPFINCISKINGVQRDNAEDLDVQMPMYNLLEYSKNYKKYWELCRNPLSSNSESFKYKKSITGKTYDGYDDADQVGQNETKVVIPLKDLSNFWRSLNIILINFEIELNLTWSKNCPLGDMTVRAAGNNNDPPKMVAPTGLKFQIRDTKLHVPAVTLSTKNDKKTFGTIKSRI